MNGFSISLRTSLLRQSGTCIMRQSRPSIGIRRIRRNGRLVRIGEGNNVGDDEIVLSGGREENSSRRWIDSARWQLLQFFFVVLIRQFVCSNEFDSGNDYVIKFGRAVKKYRRLVKDIYPSADYNDTLYIVCIQQMIFDVQCI